MLEKTKQGLLALLQAYGYTPTSKPDFECLQIRSNSQEEEAEEKEGASCDYWVPRKHERGLCACFFFFPKK